MQSTTPVAQQNIQEQPALIAKKAIESALQTVVVKVEKHKHKYFATATSPFLKDAKMKVCVNDKKRQTTSKPNKELKKLAKDAAGLRPIVDKCIDEIAQFKQAHAAPKGKKADKIAAPQETKVDQKETK